MIERYYQEMSSRVEALELRALQHTDGSSTHHQLESDTASAMTIKGPSTDALMPQLPSTSSIDRPTFSFTEILQHSWVYRRNDALNPSRLSVYSRDTCSMAWSCLSGISMADVSNVSVIGLPILVDEVCNLLRSSQTWSNNTVGPVWPITPPFELAADELAAIELPAMEDPDDDLYADRCERCMGILRKGKTVELAGNHWHLDCIWCDTCRTLLDADAGLLLLGDDSLVCNDCICYCSLCGATMGDLAIRTGDSAFCAACFKCRTCKREIQNWKYARTSQGIYCMDCHHSQMATRRKKFRLQQKPLPLLPLDCSCTAQW